MFLELADWSTSFGRSLSAAGTMGKLVLFCWCGYLQDYTPPVIMLFLVATFVFGTIGKLLGE
jgi:hypothetical protein